MALLMFSLLVLLNGFSTPPEIVVLPFPIFIVAFGEVTYSSSKIFTPPPTVVPLSVFFK